MYICVHFSETEVQVLDFYTQQSKLFPILATAYAFKFIGAYAVQRHNEVVSEINRGNVDALNEVTFGSFTGLSQPFEK